MPGALRCTNWRCCSSLVLRRRTAQISIYLVRSRPEADSLIENTCCSKRSLRAAGRCTEMKESTAHAFLNILHTIKGSCCVRVLFFRRRQIIYTHIQESGNLIPVFPHRSLAQSLYFPYVNPDLEISAWRSVLVFVCSTLLQRSRSKKDCEEQRGGWSSSSHRRILLSASSFACCHTAWAFLKGFNGAAAARTT